MAERVHARVLGLECGYAASRRQKTKDKNLLFSKKYSILHIDLIQKLKFCKISKLYIESPNSEVFQMPAALLTRDQVWKSIQPYVKQRRPLDLYLAKDISRTSEALMVALELSEIQDWVRAFDWKLILAQEPLRRRIAERHMNSERLPWDLIQAAAVELGL
jgi:hypothetical protein